MKVFFEGVDITDDVSVNSAVYDSFATGRPDDLDIVFNDARHYWAKWKPEKGNEIRIEDGALKTGTMYVDDIRQPDGKLIIGASSLPPSARTGKAKAWDDVRLLEVVNEVAVALGFTVKTYGITNHYYKHLFQGGKTGPEMLSYLCSLEGYAFLIYDKALILYDENMLEHEEPKKDIYCTSRFNPIEPIDSAIALYESCEIVTRSGIGKFTAPTVPTGANGRILRPSVYTGTVAEASRFSKGLLRANNKEEKVARIRADLMRAIAAGSTLAVETETTSIFAGNLFVQRARHDLTSNRSLLECRVPLEGY